MPDRPPPPPRLLYSQREAAELLGTSVKRLAALVRDGRLRYALDGRRRKFTAGDLDAYVAACRAAAAPMPMPPRSAVKWPPDDAPDFAAAVALLRARRRR